MSGRQRPRLFPAAVLAGLLGLVGAVASVAPPVSRLEEALGLGALFRVRGARRSPPEVVIVGIDAASARRLNLPERPDKWPRDLHARLLERLAEAGAAAVAFDVTFDQPQSEATDTIFADAIRESGNVVLCEYLRQQNLPPALAGGASGARVESLTPPIPPLAAVAATAPFPLPKTPTRVSRYWKFKSGAGDEPTLPVLLYALYAQPARAGFLALLEEVDPGASSRLAAASGDASTAPGAARAVRAMRTLTLADPTLPRRMLARLGRGGRGLSARERRTVAAFVKLFLGDESPYLDFFGPAGTVTTVPYDAVLDGTTGIDLRGRAVVVGLSELARVEQRDSFPTVFSREDGIDLNGVEIAATAFANLLEDRPVREPDPRLRLAALLAWGVVAGAICAFLPPTAAAGVVAALSAAWFALAAAWFAAAAVWPPLVVPLLIQAPLAWLGALLWRYLDEKRSRRALARAFGYYLPAPVVERLATQIREPGHDSSTVYGVILFTDVARYTGLAETMEPDRVRRVLNDYFTVLSAIVAEHGGRVSDLVGDAMLAVWVSPHADAALATSACRAAAAIDAAVNRADPAAAGTALPTRIGVHAGYISLGDVGAGEHFEYTPIGDIVNTASRIEGLNKMLGTSVLVSAELKAGTEGFLTRGLGSFLLSGKTRPVEVAELVCPRGEGADRRRALVDAFAAALGSFRREEWSAAAGGFSRCLGIDAEDGPSRFYLALCGEYLLTPPAGGMKGTVRVHEK